MKQQRILEYLKTNKNYFFGLIYTKYYGLVENYVLRNSGSRSDAQDLFQDVMIVLVEKLERDDFVLTANLKTYVVAIAKNLWLKSLRGAGYKETFDFRHENILYDEMQLSIEKERSYVERLHFLFTKMTAHCSRLLDDFYYKMKSILEIQNEYGYTSKHNAQNQKHKCIQQLRELQTKNSL